MYRLFSRIFISRKVEKEVSEIKELLEIIDGKLDKIGEANKPKYKVIDGKLGVH